MSNKISGEELRHEVTPYSMYANRRMFMKAAGAAGALAASAGVYRWFNPVRKMELTTAAIDDLKSAALSDEQRRALGFLVDEAATKESDIISYNNFYEFTTDKNAVADVAKNFKTTGWQIRVEGLVHKPKTFTIPELKSLGSIEERNLQDALC